MNKVILHIDFDSFFASVEQQSNPKFRGKPLGVTAANGRTCIIASSREAKRLGIKTAMRTFDAQRIYPAIILVKADFIKYLEISKKFLDICKDYSPYVELFSIDEVFMDITLTSSLFGGPKEIIRRIKSRIAKEIGDCITVSVGISHNKLLAKLASSLNKPNGIFEITVSDIDKIYERVKLTDICGIGERIKIRLNKIGIYNLITLRNAPISILKKEFGSVEAELLKNIGLGIDDSFVNSHTNPVELKSIGRNYCLPKNEYDWKKILQNIYELSEEIAIKLRRLNKKAKMVGLYLGGSSSVSTRKTYSSYFDTGKDIFDRIFYMFSDKIYTNNYVRQINIYVSNLIDKSFLPLSLFPQDNRKEHLIKIVDAINNKFGDHTLRSGSLLYADKLTTKPNGYTKSSFM